MYYLYWCSKFNDLYWLSALPPPFFVHPPVSWPFIQVFSMVFNNFAGGYSNGERISWAILTCIFVGFGIWKREHSGLCDRWQISKTAKRQGIRNNSLLHKIGQVIFYHYLVLRKIELSEFPNIMHLPDCFLRAAFQRNPLSPQTSFRSTKEFQT